MPVEAIYVLRHGVRSPFEAHPITGVYSSDAPWATIASADVPLAPRGVEQSHEMVPHLAGLSPPVDVVFSSLWYRCLQTVAPFIAHTHKHAHPVGGGGAAAAAKPPLLVRLEPGIGEFFAPAPWDQPAPTDPTTLAAHFPDMLDPAYEPSGPVPLRRGETLRQMHDRIGAAVTAVLARAEAEGHRAVLLVTHAASVVALVRVLSGHVPADLASGDPQVYMGGLSTLRRRPGSPGKLADWICEHESDCSFLSRGREHAWDCTMYPGDRFYFLAAGVTANGDNGAAEGQAEEHGGDGGASEGKKGV